MLAVKTKVWKAYKQQKKKRRDRVKLSKQQFSFTFRGLLSVYIRKICSQKALQCTFTTYDKNSPRELAYQTVLFFKPRQLINFYPNFGKPFFFQSFYFLVFEQNFAERQLVTKQRSLWIGPIFPYRFVCLHKMAQRWQKTPNLLPVVNFENGFSSKSSTQFFSFNAKSTDNYM